MPPTLEPAGMILASRGRRTYGLDRVGGGTELMRPRSGIATDARACVRSASGKIGPPAD